MTTEDRARAIAWFEKQAKCLAMPGAAKMFGLAAEALNAGRWIPVSERLPEYDPSKGASAYWVAKKTRNGEWQMKIALYSDYGYATTVDIPENVTWRDYDFCQIMNVTHWMPLPEPPRKDDEA